jgi:anti-sigma B factor antagonist
MNIEYEVFEGVATLALTGELDMVSAPRLGEFGNLAATEIVSTLRTDLAGLTFIDSTRLGALIAMKNKADHGRQVLILERPSERVVRVLKIAGLTKHFQIN